MFPPSLCLSLSLPFSKLSLLHSLRRVFILFFFFSLFFLFAHSSIHFHLSFFTSFPAPLSSLLFLFFSCFFLLSPLVHPLLPRLTVVLSLDIPCAISFPTSPSPGTASAQPYPHPPSPFNLISTLQQYVRLFITTSSHLPSSPLSTLNLMLQLSSFD